MEIPLAVLQGLNLSKPKEEVQVKKTPTSNHNPTQFNLVEDFCPLGCDPARTKLAISKSGRRDKGNFVNVYYRGSKLKPEVPIEVKQELFWREFDELSERNQKRSSGNRP